MKKIEEIKESRYGKRGTKKREDAEMNILIEQLRELFSNPFEPQLPEEGINDLVADSIGNYIDNFPKK